MPVTSFCTDRIVQELEMKNWPIWTYEVSSFHWTFEDKEICLLLEGGVTAIPSA